MAKKVEDVVKDVLALSGAERRELVRLLQSQLDAGLEAADAEQVWIEEIERRVAVLDKGDAELIPAADVFRRLEERFSK